MNRLSELSSQQLRQAVRIKTQIEVLERKLALMLGAVPRTQTRPRRKVDARTQRRRRASPLKRRMSAAAKKRLSKIAKARWAKVKAAGRKSL
jgi:hypothetical protein